MKIVYGKNVIFRRSHKRREMDVEYEEKKASLSLTQVKNDIVYGIWKLDYYFSCIVNATFKNRYGSLIYIIVYSFLKSKRFRTIGGMSEF